MQYARRVRKFQYHCVEGPGERFGERAFAALTHHASLSGTTIFPNLQELSWLQFSHIAQCLPFLTPSLRRVRVYVQAGPSPVRSGLPVAMDVERSASGGYAGLLGILNVRSSRIEELSLEGIELDEFPASLGLADDFSYLQTLHLGTVSTSTAAILSHCSRMPRLKSLALVLRGSSIHGAHERSQSDSSPLSAIESLRIAGAPSEIEDILHAIDSRSFHTIALSASAPEFDADGWTRCTSLLSARFASSLRTVRVECKRSSTLIPTQARSFTEYVHSLLPLHNLTECTIVIEDPAGVAMTDADVECMATSWRFLRALEVTVRGGPTATLPSISSLSTFTRSCVDLDTLRLSMSQDVSALESWASPGCTEVPRSTPSRADLRNLWIAGVRFSKIESERVVRFLKWCFPAVDLHPMVGAGVLRMD